MKIVRDELEEIPRGSATSAVRDHSDEGEFTIEDLIAEEDMGITSPHRLHQATSV